MLGGTFSSGAYNRTIGSNFGSPIGGRQAWSGNSNGYILSTVALPSTFNAHNVQLRWRLGTDNSVSGTGWRIDTVAITGDEANVPVPGSLALCGIALSALALIRRRKQV